jgi:hypothetical protein
VVSVLLLPRKNEASLPWASSHCALLHHTRCEFLRCAGTLHAVVQGKERGAESGASSPHPLHCRSLKDNIRTFRAHATDATVT